MKQLSISSGPELLVDYINGGKHDTKQHIHFQWSSPTVSFECLIIFETSRLDLTYIVEREHWTLKSSDNEKFKVIWPRSLSAKFGCSRDVSHIGNAGEWNTCIQKVESKKDFEKVEPIVHIIDIP